MCICNSSIGRMAAVRARELCRSYYRRTGVGCMREGSARFHLKNAVFIRAETWEHYSSKGAGACLMTLLMLSCICLASAEGIRDQMRDQMRMTMRQVMSGQNLQLANNGPDAAWDETFVPLFDEKWELDSAVPRSDFDTAWLPTWNAVWPHVWEAMYPKAQHGTCSYDNPCTDGSFCNFDYGESGFCKQCHVCQMEGQRFITSCSQCGLPENGTQACASTCRDNTLRLAACRADGCCRVEIEHNGIMGTVCGDGWNMRAQNVHIVCRTLGCMENGGTHVQNFGGGTGKIWMDEVRCTGTESSLVECSFNPWGSVDCGHSEDVGVCCQGCPPGIVNLPSSHSPGRRHLQQTANGTCPEGFSPSDGICEACVPGTFKSIDGNASCAPCATGNCETGFFRTLCNSTNEGICQRCSNAPEGAIYTGGPGPMFEPQKCNWMCDRASGYVSLAKNNTVCTVHERKRRCYTHETACVKCETNCSTGFFPKDCTCQPCSPEFWRPVHSEYSTWTNVPDASCGWACKLGMSKISRTGKSLCRLPCPSGTYGDANEKCQVCPAGNLSMQQLSGNTTVDDCVECTPGKYKPMLSMLDCQTRLTSSLSVGTACTSACVVLDEELSVCCRAFENFTTDTCHDLRCLRCPANTYSDTSGSTSCKQCPPGAASAIGSNKSTDCKCTRGYELHSSNCEKCPAGKYKSSEGGSCKACEPGTFSPNTAATVCLTCNSGFVSLSGSVECTGPADQVDVQICMSVTLDADNFTERQTQYAVKLADAVKVSPTSVLTNLTLVKFYTSNTTVLWNIRIPRFYVAALTNLVYTTLVSLLEKIGPPPIICSRGVKEYCGFGKEVDGASCVPCMKGKYKSAGDNSSCVACKYGTTTPDLGSISESNCGCAAGYFLNLSMVCDPCPVGTYKSDFSGECISCPEGKYSPGTIMSWPSKLCIFCPVDRYRSDKGSQSKKDCYCDVGQYSAGDFAAGTLTCLQCPTNADSPLNSTVLKNCTCNKGSSGPDGGPCTHCVSGKYKVIKGSAMCIDCKAGKYSPTLGDWVESKCLKCGKGKFSGVVGASNETTCTECTPNSTSPAQSSAQAACTCNTGYGGDASTGTCTACVAGKYKSVMNGNCTDCGAGTYSTTVGASASSTCTTCPSNSNSPEGSSALTNCTCNSGSSGPDGGPCTACVAGKYKASTGSAACTDCGAGTYSPATGAALCTSCGAGKYSTAEGASASSTCNACPSNSNSPAGSTALTNCT